MGEINALATAADGRVFYSGRAACFAGLHADHRLALPTSASAAARSTSCDPRGAGSLDQNPAKIPRSPTSGVRREGRRRRDRRGVEDEHGLLGLALDPDFTRGRPYLYVEYHPYGKGERAAAAAPGDKHRPGPGPADYMGERRSRASPTTTRPRRSCPVRADLPPWMTQVFSSCRLGGSMDCDSRATSTSPPATTRATATATNGGYTNAHRCTRFLPRHGDVTSYVATRLPHRPHPRAAKLRDPVGSLAMRLHQLRRRAPTSGNTNASRASCCASSRSLTPARPRHRDDIHDPGRRRARTARTCSRRQPGGIDGKAKPEVFAMGFRNLYSIDIDPKTDKIAVRVGRSRPGTESTTWGPAKTENAAITAGRQLRLAVLQGGNRLRLPRKLPAATGGGARPTPPTTSAARSAAAPTARWRRLLGLHAKPLLNDSPYNTGLERYPGAEPTNIWYGPQGGCYDYPHNANGVPVFTATQHDPRPARSASCPFVFGGSQAPMTAGIYRKPAGNAPNAWPAYWDGRWFLSDFAGGNNLRHALLMDPATDSPRAAAGLGRLALRDHPDVAVQREPDHRSGPRSRRRPVRGELLRLELHGQQPQHRPVEVLLRRRRRHAGSGPAGLDDGRRASSTVDIGNSGGVSYTWAVRRRRHRDRRHGQPRVPDRRPAQATLTVTYADGTTASKDRHVDVPPTRLQHVGATVHPDAVADPRRAGRLRHVAAGVANIYSANTTATSSRPPATRC